MKCSRDFAEALKQATPLMAEGDIRHFLGQAMHHWHAGLLPKVVELLKGASLDELEAMARSFAFENCELDTARVAVMRRHCKG